MYSCGRTVVLVTFMVASAFGQPNPQYPNQQYQQPYKATYQQDYKAPAYPANYAPNYGRQGNYSSYTAASGSILLQPGNVIVATGETSAINVAVPDGTEYYVNKQFELIRVDPDGLFQHSQTRVATNVEYAFHAYDDCLWFVDYTQYSDIWRLKYKDAPEKIAGQPNPVNFDRVAARSCDEAFGVAADGSLWQYTSLKWIRHKDVNNAIDAGMGTDGTLMYLGRDYNLYKWNWDTKYWEVYQAGVWVFDVYTIDVMVICDQQYYCKKWSYGKFVGIPEYCTSVNMLKDSFYCTTPQNQVKLVSYF